jgi:hypothetical protein
MKILTLITQFRQSCAGGHFISAKVNDDVNDTSNGGLSAMEAMCLLCNEVSYSTNATVSYNTKTTAVAITY